MRHLRHLRHLCISLASRVATKFYPQAITVPNTRILGQQGVNQIWKSRVHHGTGLAAVEYFISFGHNATVTFFQSSDFLAEADTKCLLGKVQATLRPVPIA